MDADEFQRVTQSMISAVGLNRDAFRRRLLEAREDCAAQMAVIDIQLGILDAIPQDGTAADGGPSANGDRRSRAEASHYANGNHTGGAEPDWPETLSDPTEIKRKILDVMRPCYPDWMAQIDVIRALGGKRSKSTLGGTVGRAMYRMAHESGELEHDEEGRVYRPRTRAECEAWREEHKVEAKTG